MEKTIKIKHSLPVHNCFMIMQPARKNYASRCLLVNKETGELYELEDVKDGTCVMAILLDYYTFEMRELPETLCYLSYGSSKEITERALSRKYPSLRQSQAEVEVLVLMKLDDK